GTTPAIKTSTSTLPSPSTTTSSSTSPSPSTTTSPTTTTPTPTKTTPTPTQTATQTTTPKIPAKSSSEPVTIPPTKVSRTSGAVPSIKGSSSLAGEKIPANISAKVCIDTGGSVTSTKVLTKLPEEARSLLERSIKGWRYTPYKDGGSAVPACFVASFRSN